MPLPPYVGVLPLDARNRSGLRRIRPVLFGFGRDLLRRPFCVVLFVLPLASFSYAFALSAFSLSPNFYLSGDRVPSISPFHWSF